MPAARRTFNVLPPANVIIIINCRGTYGRNVGRNIFSTIYFISIFSKTRTANVPTQILKWKISYYKNCFFFIAIDDSKTNRTNAEQDRDEKSLGQGFTYIGPLKIFNREEVNFVKLIKILTAVDIEEQRSYQMRVIFFQITVLKLIFKIRVLFWKTTRVT